MVRSIIVTLAILLTFGSAVFLVKANLVLTADAIAQLSSTRWNGNREVARSLCQTQADTRVGFVILFVAVGLQMVNAAWPMRWKDFEVSVVGVFVAVALFGATMAVGWWGADRLADRNFERVEALRGDSSPGISGEESE